MLKFIICNVCLILTLSGCTVAGFVVDSTVYTKADENYDADLAVDRYLVELVQQGVEPDVVCTRVSKSVKICEEVNTHNLTGTESNQADTVDEIIGVRL